jgi:hypothetical protein
MGLLSIKHEKPRRLLHPSGLLTYSKDKYYDNTINILQDLLEVNYYSS